MAAFTIIVSILFTWICAGPSAAATVELSPSYDSDPMDLVGLRGGGSARALIFDLAHYTPNSAEISFVYANRDTIFHELGEIVEGANLEVRIRPFFSYRITGIVAPSMREAVVPFPPLQLEGDLVVEMSSTGPDAILIGGVRLTMTDEHPPARTSDLSAAMENPRALRVRWTAPGDDGNTGRATLYRLFYSRAPIGADTTAWLQGAAPAPDMPVPAPAGRGEEYILSGLEPRSAYCLLLQSEDDFGNKSGYSNPACAATGGGDPGMALSFDGLDDFVRFPDRLAVFAKDFTIEMWLNIAVLDDDDNITLLDMRHQAYGNGDSRNAGLYVGLRVDREPFISFITVDDFMYNQAVMGPGTATTGVWNHLAFSRRGTTLVGYWNGERVVMSESINPGPILWRDDYTGAHLGLPWPTVPLWGYNGTMDEVRFWNVSRSQEEIRSTMHRSLAGSEPGLVGYWTMDEGAGQIVTDHAGPGNDGTLGENQTVEGYDPTWVPSTAPIWRLLQAARWSGAATSPRRDPRAVPNPFSQVTSIGYFLPEPGSVSIRIYDVEGRLLRDLLTGVAHPSGSFEAPWSGDDDEGDHVPAGRYYYEVEIGGQRRTGEMTLVR